MEEKDGLEEAQKKYEEKVTSRQPLEEDAGGLGKNRSRYDEKKVGAGHGLHSPRGGLAAARAQYVKKQTRRDHGAK